MTIKEIKELLDLFSTTDVAELEVQRGENRVRLVRAGTQVTHVVPASAPATVASPIAAAPAPVAAAVLDNTTVVKSPIVGTFYDAPSPDAPPFVKVGDTVETGQVLCIIESMKLMNEIECEVAGTVVAKLLENGRPVEYGEALFSVKLR